MPTSRCFLFGRAHFQFAATAVLVLASALFPAVASAQGNAAAAEAFFQDGRALFDAGKFAEACPKLAESHRLDPATGTLLTLALCHEGEGKLASAWAEFTEVEGRARREGRDDRVTIAVDRAAALKPRLSTLAIDVPAEVLATPGLEVKLDGVVVGAPSFGVTVPIDGGEHRVEATAPGKAPWQGSAVVKVEGDAQRVAVPALAAAAPERTVPQGAETPPPAVASPEGASSDSSWMSPVGLVAAGAGAVALGVGGFLALDAKADYSSARKRCGGPDGLDCKAGPYGEVQSAQKQGNAATVVMGLGGVVLAGGAALWFFAPRAKGEKASSSLQVRRVALGPGRVALEGSF